MRWGASFKRVSILCLASTVLSARYSLYYVLTVEDELNLARPDLT